MANTRAELHREELRALPRHRGASVRRPQEDPQGVHDLDRHVDAAFADGHRHQLEAVLESVSVGEAQQEPLEDCQVDLTRR